MGEPTYIDSRLPRFNQAVLAIVLAVAFVLDVWVLVPLMGLVLLLGVAAGPTANPVQLLFIKGIKPRLGPPHEIEDSRPPRFAAAVGVLFLAASAATFLAGWRTFGWALSIIVLVLAALAAATGLCVGCEIFVFFKRMRGSMKDPWRRTAGGSAPLAEQGASVGQVLEPTGSPAGVASDRQS